MGTSSNALRESQTTIRRNSCIWKREKQNFLKKNILKERIVGIGEKSIKKILLFLFIVASINKVSCGYKNFYM